MASVALKFTPPDMENLVELKIFESAAKDGIYNEIDSVSPVGLYPDYIDNYTTDQATNLNNWFCIQWVDDKGAASNRSDSIQGNTTTAVAEIVSRVLMRDPSIDERVAVQEAEAAIQTMFPGIDPYDPSLQLSYVQKRGITNFTLAMCYLTEMAQTQSADWVAGIVSMKTSDAAIKQRADSIENLLKAANKDLNMNFSMIAILEDLEIAGGSRTIDSFDQTRLLVTIR